MKIVNPLEIESYRTRGGTCCRQIIYSVSDDEVLTMCKFVHGCSGNLQGITRLCVGRNIDEIIKALSGISCKGNTSCPDQLTKALEDYKKRKSEAIESAERERAEAGSNAVGGAND
ncbi:MAG: TIGR03905 family TSCPD domain-containing protein [Firmicutes bacterium]|nr:TIGR03905 family TSCPD domain-containing protein [Bacillota bacterium]